MYISMIELMKKAREGHYCVPAVAVEKSIPCGRRFRRLRKKNLR